MTVVLAADQLTKEYRTGFRMKRVRAVDGASFAVRRGEVYGFVGPNGAGKTTTIRTILGLVRPTGGSCTLFGLRGPVRAARARLGFLPEAPYFYEYLTPVELLDLVGRLHGLDPAARKARAAKLLERVGLGAAAARPLRKFSKGMLQRTGLAQALMNDPELLILDEPMSGLDPIGRKEVRDLILEERDRGKTIFFSTHILPDVEAICDRVALIVGGKILDEGPVGKIVEGTLQGTDVVVRAPGEVSFTELAPAGARVRRVEDEVTITLAADADVNAFLGAAAARGRIVSVTPRRQSLEDLFVKRIRERQS